MRSFNKTELRWPTTWKNTVKTVSSLTNNVVFQLRVWSTEQQIGTHVILGWVNTIYQVDVSWNKKQKQLTSLDSFICYKIVFGLSRLAQREIVYFVKVFVFRPWFETRRSSSLFQVQIPILEYRNLKITAVTQPLGERERSPIKLALWSTGLMEALHHIVLYYATLLTNSSNLRTTLAIDPHAGRALLASTLRPRQRDPDRVRPPP